MNKGGAPHGSSSGRPAAGHTRGRGKNKKFLAAIAVFLLAAAVYSNSLLSGFVWDDSALIIQKQAFFSSPGNALKIFALSDAPSGGEFPYYRPLNTLSYMADHYLWGLHPFWYHLENVLLHALAAVLFYLLLLEAFKDRRLAFFAAALFAVYPVNTEAVDAIFNRNTLFCAFFCLASLLLLAKNKKTLSLLAYVLALLSKEPAVALPFFLLSMGLLEGGLFSKEGAPAPGEEGQGFKSKYENTGKDKGKNKNKNKEDIFLLAWFFGITAVYFLVRRLVLGAFVEKAGLGLSLQRLKLIAAVCFEHFRLMVFPYRLNAYYSMRRVFSSFSFFKAVSAFSGLLLLGFLAVRRKTPGAVRAGALWILWGLLPVSNIVKIPSAPVAERYQYTIISGFVLIIGYLAASLSRRRAAAGIFLFPVLLPALLITLGARTFERNYVWRDNRALYESMVRSDPRNPLALNNLGTVYLAGGDYQAAIREFKAALAADPSYPNTYKGLGTAYARTGRLNDALLALKTAVALTPGDGEAVDNLGVVYGRLGFYREAEAEFREALRINSGDALARRYLEQLASGTAAARAP